uniref:Bm13056 n=1 Tax=Brugia malayi TaxID=6279 RepID=A0A1I9GF11_BRUMA|nr:Bm13056 [Brugia malayi]
MKTPPGVRRRVPSAINIPPDASIPRVASNNSRAFSSPISIITLTQLKNK